MDRIMMDNVIRISGKKSYTPEKYIYAILMRMQPSIYNKYECIKLRFTKDLRYMVNELCKLFWHAGLVVKTWQKIENLKVDKGVFLDNIIEVSLQKIPAIEFEDDEDYKDWVKEVEENG